MIRAAYILSFDRDDSVDYQDLHKEIINLPRVLNWFHYIKSSYILIANTNYVNRLNEEIKPLFKDKSYLLVKLDLLESNGFLPQKAWDWIDKQIIAEPVSSARVKQMRQAVKKVAVIAENAQSFKIGKTGIGLDERLAEPDYDGVYKHIVALVRDSNPDVISDYESALIDRFLENEKCDNKKDGEQSENDTMAKANAYYVYLVWR